MVQSEIRAILFEKPNTPLTKGALYKEVCKNLECLRPTFYTYLSEMSLIRQYEENGKHYAVYDYEEKVEKIDVDLKKYGASSQLAVELTRPLSLLTLDNIDIALFEFGLIFENKLKGYLLKAKSEGSVNVKSKDMSRLFNMIECVIREGVVKKGHHLNTLREERNNRAHGKVPTLSERQVLFNKGHYLVDLFIKYIVFFDQKTAS